MNVMTMVNSRKTLPYLEQGFVLVSLLFFLSNPLKLIALRDAGQSFQGGSNVLEQVIFLTIHLASIGLIVINREQICAELLKRDKLILFSIFILLIVIMLSASWSSYPDLTMRRGFALWGTTFFGVYFSTCFSYKKQFLFLSQVYGLVAILSLLIALLLPTYGVMSDAHSGAWRGIFLHKNGLGSSMVLSVSLFLSLYFSSSSRKYLKLFLLGLSVFLLLFSTSKNALLVFLLLSCLFPIFALLKLRIDLMIPMLLGMVFLVTLGAVIILGNLGDILGIIGKDATLTGRTDIWPSVWESIDQKIWLGYGYQGFWQGFDSEAARIWYTVGWEPTHPHNGLLELLLVFGFLCTALFLLVFMLLCVRSIIWARVSRSPEYFWAFIFLIYTLASNIAETKVLEYNKMSWVLYIMVAMLVSRPIHSHFLKS